MIFGLTQLGVLHTIVSLIAVAAGLAAFIRERRISPTTQLGRIYIWTTVITCLTGFGIFQHGGFGKPHALGIITLAVLGVAWAAGSTNLFGALSAYIETLGYSLTFFFHMIPGITETSTRLPLGAPLLPSADAPELVVATAALFFLFLVGAALQVMRLRSERRRLFS